jgi:hypothetical protein
VTEGAKPLHEELFDATCFRGSEQSNCFIKAQQLDWRRFRVILDSPVGTVSGDATDFFAALQEARRPLEAAGWLLAVQGARRGVWPSGMLREANGQSAYVLPADPNVRPDGVMIFDPAPPELVGTVEDQEAAWEEWKRLPRG